MTISFLHIYSDCEAESTSTSDCNHGVCIVYDNGREKAAELSKEVIEALIDRVQIVVNESFCFEEQCALKKDPIPLTSLTLSSQCSQKSKLSCSHSCSMIYKNGYTHIGEFNEIAIKSLIKIADYVDNKSDCFKS